MEHLPWARNSFKSCISRAHFNFTATLGSGSCYYHRCSEKKQEEVNDFPRHGDSGKPRQDS